MFAPNTYPDLDANSFNCLVDNDCLDIETFDSMQPTKPFDESAVNFDPYLPSPASASAAPAPRPATTHAPAQSRRHKVHANGRRSFKDYTKPIKRGYLNRQIPANDVRRSLAQMLVRACNDHNPDLLTELMHKFCVSSLVLTSRFIGNVENCPMKMGATYRELHGIPHITKYLDTLFTVVPDGLIRLIDTKVHMFQNGCSYIVGKFTFQGSKCFDVITQGDLRGKRCLPSKFDRRNKQARLDSASSGSGPEPSLSSQNENGEYLQEQVDASYEEDLPYNFHFDMDNHCASLSDLEDILFDDMDNDQDFFAATAPTSHFFDSVAAGQDKQTISVALENRAIDFVIPHNELEVSPIPLHVLGTMAFYLDPDANIFKIEILNTIEAEKNGRLAMKRPRRC